MDAMQTDELWSQVAARIHSSCGWSLRPLAQLGTPRDTGRTWLAEPVGDGGPGRVIIKASANPSALARAAWTASAMGLLGERGYPVPALLWHGALDERWFVVVQARLPGQPLRTLDAAMLDRLLALVDLQADQAHGLGEGGWDLSWWIGAVLFQGWEHWWDAAQTAAPQTSRRLRAFLQPAWGHRLPATDLVHGDLNLSNVLAAEGVITGVVDWDHVGIGCRAADLAGLPLDWHRLHLADARGLAADGAERLVGRIVEIGGDQGLRCVVAYGAVARLGLAAQRGEPDALRTWRHVTRQLLDSLR
jgi:Phosphotransferase enzyme family